MPVRQLWGKNVTVARAHGPRRARCPGKGMRPTRFLNPGALLTELDSLRAGMAKLDKHWKDITAADWDRTVPGSRAEHVVAGRESAFNEATRAFRALLAGHPVPDDHRADRLEIPDEQ